YWNWLRCVSEFARDIALRYRTFFDAEERLAGFAIQDVHVTGLRGQRQGGDGAAIAHDVEQTRRGRRIVIPEDVMDRLEVPLVRARLDIHGDHRVSEQVRAFAVSSVISADRGSQRQIQKPALLIQREIERPGVDAEAAFPTVAFP